MRHLKKVCKIIEQNVNKNINNIVNTPLLTTVNKNMTINDMSDSYSSLKPEE